MKSTLFTDDEKKEKVKELTSLFLHKHYCENDTEPIISHLDDSFLWFGAAEHEYITDVKETIDVLRSFAGKVPTCHISGEQYDVIQPVRDLFVCTGMLWICTSPSSNIYLRVHQRVTTVFRWTEEGLRCCHIHLSNPYAEMEEGDVGFPEKMSRESRKYFQEQIEAQKKKIEEQHSFIVQMYFEDLSTGLYNRNKFNQTCKTLRGKSCERLGVAYFDLNGLKQVNDRLGHQAGDDLLFRTAGHLRRRFDKKAYRIGGDEFIVIDGDLAEKDFLDAVQAVVAEMEEDGISISCGHSWRSGDADIDKQIHEADRHMYLNKQDFYSRMENNRRKR